VWSGSTRDETTAVAFNFNQGTATTYRRDDTGYTTRAFAVRRSGPWATSKPTS